MVKQRYETQCFRLWLNCSFITLKHELQLIIFYKYLQKFKMIARNFHWIMVKFNHLEIRLILHEYHLIIFIAMRIEIFTINFPINGIRDCPFNVWIKLSSCLNVRRLNVQLYSMAGKMNNHTQQPSIVRIATCKWIKKIKKSR